MTSRPDDVTLVDAPDAALAARLDAEIAAFSFDATKIRAARDFAAALHDDDRELIAGVQGWTWGATCLGELPDYPVGHANQLLRKRVR